MSRYDDLVQEHAERRQHDAETRASFDALPAAFRDAEVERLRAEGLVTRDRPPGMMAMRMVLSAWRKQERAENASERMPW